MASIEAGENAWAHKRFSHTNRRETLPKCHQRRIAVSARSLQINGLEVAWE